VSDHEWLTEEGVEILAGLLQLDMIPEGANQVIIGRLIDDWLTYHGLWERLDGVRIVGELPGAEPIWDEVDKMLKATADD